MAKNNIPRHVGFIPDGNRRWAIDHSLSKEAGYADGINPGLLLYEVCKEHGIKEVSIYCFMPRAARYTATIETGSTMRVDGKHGATLGYEPNSDGEWQDQPDFAEPPLNLEGAANHLNHREDDDY